MSDIYTESRLCDIRWDWDALGVSSVLPRACSPSDIDGVIELDGYFLFIENKPEVGDLPLGQEILYRRLAGLPNCSVIVLYGAKNDPLGYRHVRPYGRPQAEPITFDGISLEGRRRAVVHLVRMWARHVEAAVEAVN